MVEGLRPSLTLPEATRAGDRCNKAGLSSIIPYYGKFSKVLVKSPITLLSPPRFSAADQLPPHALPVLPNT